MIKLVFATLLSFFALTQSSFAGIVIEPQVGYSTGTIDPGISGVDKIDLSGMNLGAKLYYNTPTWFLGMDYNNNNLKVKDSDDNLKNNEIGAIVGFNISYFFKIYGGYIFSNSAKVGELDLEHSSGYKAGLSFLALRHLAIGLEYKKIGYKDVSGLNDPFYTATTFFVSFPFGI